MREKKSQGRGKDMVWLYGSLRFILEIGQERRGRGFI